MSETFQVTARKWRPMRFDEVVGQDHVTRTLKNAIREARIAHAYLFTGQRGCGKTTVARILAKAINCPNGAKNNFEPCNACDVCIGITEGRSMDVSEIDGASNNSVDDVRTMRENVKYPPLHGEFKVIIIDEVHMLSTSAFNALLKTLEEPPSHLVFIFATTEVQKVLPTILSRTQRYDFRRMQIDEIITRLKLIADTEKITIDDDALLIIAKKGDGSMRDAQSIFDQVLAYCGPTVDSLKVREALNLIDTDFYFEVTEAVASRDAGRAFSISEQIMSRGYDVEEFFIGLLEHFRNMLTVRLTKNTKHLEVSKVHQDQYHILSESYTEGDTIRMVRLAQHALERLKTAVQPRLMLELTLVEMIMMERAVEISTLLDELRALRLNESALLKSGAVASERRSAAATPTNPAVVKSKGKAMPMAEGKTLLEESSPTPAATPSKRVSSTIQETPDEQAPSQDNAANNQRRAFAALNSVLNGGSDSSVDIEAETKPQASAPVLELTTEGIRAEWTKVLQALRERSKMLAAQMEFVEYCGMSRGIIYLGSEEKDTQDFLRNMQGEILDALRKYFRVPSLLIEIGTPESMYARSGEPRRESLASPAARIAEGQRSELEEMLIRELGAQPL